MKTFENFKVDINEALPLIPLAVGATRLGLGAYGAYRASKAYQRGDYTGAALNTAMALNPLGGIGALAGVADHLRPKEKKVEKKSEESKPVQQNTAPVQQDTKLADKVNQQRVLSKLRGVEGTGVGKDFVAQKWSDAERQRYADTRGAEKLKQDVSKLTKQPTVGQKVAAAGQMYGARAFKLPKISA